MGIDCDKCGGNWCLCMGRCDEEEDYTSRVQDLREELDEARRVLNLFCKVINRTLSEIDKELERIQEDN